MTKFNALSEFVDVAVKNRKYPEVTAQGLKSALKLFEAELKEEEVNSLDVFEKNIEQIYKAVSQKNSKKFTAASLATYKSRVIKVINDYKKYGIDTTKMANWEPKLITRTKKHTTIGASSAQGSDETVRDQLNISTNMHRIELALRPDCKFVIVVPRDITSDESKTLKAILDSLVM